jgi:hypothetical protein
MPWSLFLLSNKDTQGGFASIIMTTKTGW